MERIRVNASRAYDVVIGSGILESIGAEMSSLINGKRSVIIADDITNGIYGERVKRSICDAGFSVESFVFPHGEESKSAKTFVDILEFLAEAKLNRADSIVALGGGVVGDITGFAAASFLRGIKFVQIPTTLLAAVDSSVGGKTAINLTAGTNLAGAFYQPSLVLCDTDIMRDLPEKIFADGMAEVIKYGAIRSIKVLELIKSGAKENLPELIAECVKIKRDVVSEDEFDTGLRQLLNFGHTPAHAIEKLSHFEISHGSAVAVGMCIMAKASEKLGMCEAGIYDEIKALCREFSLPTEVSYTAEELFSFAMSDKKRSAGYVTLVVPKVRGESVLHKVPEDEMKKFFALGTEV